MDRRVGKDGVAEQPQEHRVEVAVPPDHEAGGHAGFAAVWRSQDPFVIGFATGVRPSEVADGTESGTRYVDVPARGVSRVRVPASQVRVARAQPRRVRAGERQKHP